MALLAASMLCVVLRLWYWPHSGHFVGPPVAALFASVPRAFPQGPNVPVDETKPNPAFELGDPTGVASDFSPRTRLLLGLRMPSRRQRQRLAGRFAPMQTTPVDCRDGCSGRGSCHRVPTRSGTLAYCLCPPGWAGEACQLRDDSPCNTPDGGRVPSRCAGTCDADVNRCVCGNASRHPARPMRACYYDGVEQTTPWLTPEWGTFAHGPRSHFWGGPGAENARSAVAGWCDADSGQRPRQRCSCYDGAGDGSLCGLSAAYCVNQCSGEERGHCRNGHCLCRPGYQGIDCSIREAAPVLADWVNPNQHHHHHHHHHHHQQYEQQQHEQQHEQPQQHFDDGSVSPRVYVYEIPPDYNMLLLARRLVPDACVLRTYATREGPLWSGNLYGAEVALHEALLASPHRTLEPGIYIYIYIYVFEIGRASCRERV